MVSGDGIRASRLFLTDLANECGALFIVNGWAFPFILIDGIMFCGFSTRIKDGIKQFVCSLFVTDVRTLFVFTSWAWAYIFISIDGMALAKLSGDHIKAQGIGSRLIVCSPFDLASM